MVRVEHKIFTVKIGNEPKHFNKSQVIPVPDHPDKELEWILKGTSQFNSDKTRLEIIESIKNNDNSYDSDKANAAFAKELAGLISKGVFRIVLKKYVEKVANILGSRSILYIKNIKTGEEKYRLVS